MEYSQLALNGHFYKMDTLLKHLELVPAFLYSF